METGKEIQFKTFGGRSLFSREWAPRNNSGHEKAIFWVRAAKPMASTDSIEHAVAGLSRYSSWIWLVEPQDLLHFSRDFDEFVLDRLAAENIPMSEVVILVEGELASNICTWVLDAAPNLKAVICLHPDFDAARELRHRLITYSFQFQPPVLMIASLKNWGAKKWFEALGSSRKEFHIYPKVSPSGGLVSNASRDQILADIFPFLSEKREESQKIGTPIVQASSRRNALQNLLSRFLFVCFERLGRNRRISRQLGANSQAYKDYVCFQEEREPTGILQQLFHLPQFWLEESVVGTDELASVKRQNLNMTECLEFLFTILHGNGRGIRILDLAGGASRYLVEALYRHKDWDVKAEMRDRSLPNLKYGQEIAMDRGVSHLVTFRNIDFRKDSGFSHLQKPNIVILNGLFEELGDLAAMKTLENLDFEIDASAYILLKNQSWMTDSMRAKNDPSKSLGTESLKELRSQAQVDQFMVNCGWEKAYSLPDQEGRFTLSIFSKARGKRLATTDPQL